MKLWRKTRGEHWTRGDCRISTQYSIWSIDENLGQGKRKYEIHAWVLYDGKQVVTVKSSKRAIFRIANRHLRKHARHQGTGRER